MKQPKTIQEEREWDTRVAGLAYIALPLAFLSGLILGLRFP